MKALMTNPLTGVVEYAKNSKSIGLDREEGKGKKKRKPYDARKIKKGKQRLTMEGAV